jgi:hypothetical protein
VEVREALSPLHVEVLGKRAMLDQASLEERIKRCRRLDGDQHSPNSVFATVFFDQLFEVLDPCCDGVCVGSGVDFYKHHVLVRISADQVWRRFHTTLGWFLLDDVELIVYHLRVLPDVLNELLFRTHVATKDVRSNVAIIDIWVFKQNAKLDIGQGLV